MKKLIPIFAMSLFALGACATTSTSTKSGDAMAKPDAEEVSCTPGDADNPQCGTGGPASTGPITNSVDGCTPGDPDNPQCGTGGPASTGPITDR